jgi:hypothetical protein
MERTLFFQPFQKPKGKQRGAIESVQIVAHRV